MIDEVQRFALDSLLNELKLDILHLIRDSIPSPPFESAPLTSMAHHDAYVKVLLDVALSHRSWTAIAQFELCQRPILRNDRKMNLFLKTLKGSEELRGYAMTCGGIRLGRMDWTDQGGMGWEAMNTIDRYCPNISEICCSRIDIGLEFFKNMKHLKSFNVYLGSLLPPTTWPASPLTVTSLYIDNVGLEYEIVVTPAALPLLNTLHLSNQTLNTSPLHPLLPSISTLFLHTALTIGFHDLLRPDHSKSLQSISLSEYNISSCLTSNSASRTIVQDHIRILRVMVQSRNVDPECLKEIIEGSKKLDKVILDGTYFNSMAEAEARLGRILDVIRAACKQKSGIELWKENFFKNGKIELD